jgi:ornithine carbamoyltransferase
VKHFGRTLPDAGGAANRTGIAIQQAPRTEMTRNASSASTGISMRHLITLCDLSGDEIERIFAITEDLKSKCERGIRETLLPGRVVALLFEKPSLRTRVSFEVAIAHLGGNSMLLGKESGFGSRESKADFGRVLSQYVDAIVVRAFRHDDLVQLAEHCTCSVVNGLTDFAHPCQGLADLFTLRELLGDVRAARLAYIGDANNVARSLALGCAKVGMELAVASPPGFGFDEAFLALHRQQAPAARLIQTHVPAEALEGAAAVYTDVWTSMGQESERQRRRTIFADFQINAERMKLAAPDAVFMHCLPARRGEEVTTEVIDGPQSVVVHQAANRLHAQKGILTWLLGAKGN